jgi:ribose transport system substrate-binding protein
LAAVLVGSGAGGVGAKTTVSAINGIPTTGQMVNTTKYKTAPPWTIGYADSSLSNSWRTFAWQYMQYGASLLPKNTIIHTNANDSIPKQVSDIQDLLARKVQCLIVSATSATALNPVIASASKQVPVVIQERSVTTNQYTSFASLDAVNMGVLQARAVAKALHGKGNIVILEGVAGSGPVVQSLQGMHSVLNHYPGIHILTTQYTNWALATGKTDMENDLTAFRKIDAVLSDSGLQNDGAFEAVKAAGRLKQIKAWTGDTDQTWLRLVNNNHLPGIVVDRPTKVALNSVKLCGAILSGQPVPKIWKTENQVIKPAALHKYIAPNVAGSAEWWDWWDLPSKWLPKGH